MWGSFLSSACVSERFKPPNVPFRHPGHLRKPRRRLCTISRQEFLCVSSTRPDNRAWRLGQSVTGMAALTKARGAGPRTGRSVFLSQRGPVTHAGRLAWPPTASKSPCLPVLLLCHGKRRAAVLPAVGPGMPRSALGGDDVEAGSLAVTNAPLWCGVDGGEAVPVRGQEGHGKSLRLRLHFAAHWHCSKIQNPLLGKRRQSSQSPPTTVPRISRGSEPLGPWACHLPCPCFPGDFQTIVGGETWQEP